MYIQTSKTTINGKTYECKTVRESFRTPKGPRSRLVCNISKLPENIQAAIEALLKTPIPTSFPPPLWASRCLGIRRHRRFA